MPSSRPGTVASFYSYKGGVGRTMAVVNVAMALAHNGFKVMVVDLDLLAPGVQQYPPFKEVVESSTEYVAPDKREFGCGGILDLVERQLWSFAPEDSPFHEQLRPSDEKKERWKEWMRNVYKHSASGGYIDVLPAGPADHRALGVLAQTGWYRFLTEFKGFDLMLRMRDEWWGDEYDFTLIDSRTGLSDYLQFCVGILPDVSILIAGLNEQNVEGFDAVIDSVKEVLASRESDLFIIPVLSLIPSAELDKVRERLGKAEESLGSEIEVGERSIRFLTRESVKLPYVATLAVAERLVVPDDHHAPIFREYVRIAEMIARHKFVASQNLLDLAMYDSSGRQIADPSLEKDLKRARESSEREKYMYGRIVCENYDARRLAFTGKKGDRALSIERFKTAVKLIRERRHLKDGEGWGKDSTVGHWKIELDTLVFYARILFATATSAEDTASTEEGLEAAIAAFTDALNFMNTFEKRNHADIFSDRDWDRYFQELLFTRAFCHLSQLEAQIVANNKGGVFPKSTLQAHLRDTQALFDLRMPTVNPALKERLAKCANDIERLP